MIVVEPGGTHRNRCSLSAIVRETQGPSRRSTDPVSPVNPRE